MVHRRSAPAVVARDGGDGPVSGGCGHDARLDREARALGARPTARPGVRRYGGCRAVSIERRAALAPGRRPRCRRRRAPGCRRAPLMSVPARSTTRAAPRRASSWRGGVPRRVIPWRRRWVLFGASMSLNSSRRWRTARRSTSAEQSQAVCCCAGARRGRTARAYCCGPRRPKGCRNAV